jgi:hypothetical protein
MSYRMKCSVSMASLTALCLTETLALLHRSGLNYTSCWECSFTCLLEIILSLMVEL